MTFKPSAFLDWPFLNAVATMELRAAQARQEEIIAGCSAGRLGLRLLYLFGLRYSGVAAKLTTPQLCLLCTSLPAHQKERSIMSSDLHETTRSPGDCWVGRFHPLALGDFLVPTKAGKETGVMLNWKQVAILAEEAFEGTKLIEPLRVMKNTAFWRLSCPRCPK